MLGWMWLNGAKNSQVFSLKLKKAEYNLLCAVYRERAKLHRDNSQF